MLNNKVIKIIITFLILLLFNITITANDDLNFLKEFEVMTENESLTLLIDKKTTEIAVKNKKTGNIWFSNPQLSESMETKLSGKIKDRLKSQIIIKYIDPRNTEHIMDNYNDSVILDGYEINKINNGVRISYVFGKNLKKKY